MDKPQLNWQSCNFKVIHHVHGTQYFRIVRCDQNVYHENDLDVNANYKAMVRENRRITEIQLN